MNTNFDFHKILGNIIAIAMIVLSIAFWYVNAQTDWFNPRVCEVTVYADICISINNLQSNLVLTILFGLVVFTAPMIAWVLCSITVAAFISESLESYMYRDEHNVIVRGLMTLVGMIMLVAGPVTLVLSLVLYMIIVTLKAFVDWCGAYYDKLTDLIN